MKNNILSGAQYFSSQQQQQKKKQQQKTQFFFFLDKALRSCLAAELLHMDVQSHGLQWRSRPAASADGASRMWAVEPPPEGQQHKVIQHNTGKTAADTWLGPDFYSVGDLFSDC